jgi:hypothetical protein
MLTFLQHESAELLLACRGNTDMLLLLLNDAENGVIGQGIDMINERNERATRDPREISERSGRDLHTVSAGRKDMVDPSHDTHSHTSTH